MRWAVACVFFLCAAGVHAQTYFRCKGQQGETIYVTTPCKTGGKPVTTITPQDKAAAQVGTTKQEIDNAINRGQSDLAAQIAQDSGLSNYYQSRMQEQAYQQQVQATRAQQAQVDNLAQQNAELAAQNQELTNRAEDADRKAREAQARAQRARNDASNPKFNPQTGQWCQQIGGTIQCH